jgi:anti-sigma factor RsiW
MKIDAAQMTSYLLGLLPEKDESAIEARLAVDDDLHAQLLAIEDELLADYGADKLTAQHRDCVEQRLLASPEALERVRLGRALSRRAETAAQSATDSLWTRLLRALRGPRLAVAAAVACAAVIAIIWVTRPAPEQRVAMAEITLEATSIRSGTRAQQLPAGSQVRIALELEPRVARGYERLLVLVAGRTVQPDLSREGTATLVLDTAALAPGLLEIELVGESGQTRETIAYYEVLVPRRSGSDRPR